MLLLLSLGLFSRSWLMLSRDRAAAAADPVSRMDVLLLEPCARADAIDSVELMLAATTDSVESLLSQTGCC